MHDERYGKYEETYFNVVNKSGSIEKRMISNHYHSYYEAFYFLGNDMNYFIDNANFQLNKYDMVFIEKYTYHRTVYHSSSKERILTGFGDDIIHLVQDEGARKKIYALLKLKKVSFPKEFNEYLIDSYTKRLQPTFGSSASSVGMEKAKHIFIEILLSIVELMDEGRLENDVSPISVREKRVADIINYINANFSSNINLDMLSSEFYVNKYYLCHVFKEITGISVVDYINNKRLVEAEKLLKISDKCITDIAGDVGFNSVNYFIVLFKKKYGCTPSNMKKNINNYPGSTAFSRDNY